MATIFTKIINGDIPSYKIGEDEDNYAFLDISPVHPGHVLVVPKLEIDYIYDLPEKEFNSLQNFAKKVAKAIKIAIPCNRVGVMVMGLEVPHAHIHLIPIDKPSDMSFFKGKLSLEAKQMEDIARSISEAL